MIQPFLIQDTLKNQIIIRQDSLSKPVYSPVQLTTSARDSILPVKILNNKPLSVTELSDTSTVCIRNEIADITFYDPSNLITRMDDATLYNFPFIFTSINRKIRENAKAETLKHLREGEPLSQDTFHNDWILPLILLSVFIYGIIKSESVKSFQGMMKFIGFRGINEPVSRDLAGIFQWQSTLLNLASFVNISLFAFLALVWYDVLPPELNRFIYWGLTIAVVIAALTVRHFICLITGNISGHEEAFREYLLGIYQSYRLSGILLLIVSILILYFSVVPAKSLFNIGFIVVALAYIIRVLRLLFIFINRHVSIFYLILYLCALEILPVVIIVKYVTGLV